jgi:hypothetical protein
MPEPITAAMAVMGGSSIISGGMNANAARKAGKQQAQSAQMGVDEQRRQFEALQAGLAPYAQAGVPALAGQQNLIGLGGADAQAQAIQQLQDSPMFRQLAQQGENAILQNASATGGLRGGNTQAALAQFRPNMLSALIDQQYGRLGGIASMGQNSVLNTGQAGMQTGQNIAGLYGQQGAAQAGATLGKANAFGQALGGVAQAFGGFMGNGGFSQFGGKTPPPTGGGFGFMETNSGIDPNAYYNGVKY